MKRFFIFSLILFLFPMVFPLDLYPQMVPIKGKIRKLDNYDRGNNESSVMENKNNRKETTSDDMQGIINANFSNAKVRTILKTIANQGGFNLIIGPNVRGSMDIKLVNVPAFEAFKSVIQAANLAYVKKGSVYIIMTERDYLQNYGHNFSDNRSVKIISLNYADAGDILSSIKGMMSKIGTINVDQRTNSLIIYDSEKNIKMIEDAIREIDRPLITEVFSLNYMTTKQVENLIKGIISKKGHYQADDSTNKIIVSDYEGNIDKIRKIIKEYDVPPKLETRVYKLNYASIDKIEPKIKELLTPKIGKISSDERTNSIVIIDLPANLEKLEEVIRAYDEKVPEVLIEAKIVQVQLSDRFQYGINWQFLFDSVLEGLDFNVLSAFEKASSSDNNNSDTDSDSSGDSEGNSGSEDNNNSTSFADTITSFSEGGARIVVTGKLGSNDFDAVINALKVVGNTNVLSSPRILAIDGEEAKIQVATKQAYVTDTVSQSQSTTTTAENVTFIDVGVILTVTPKINKDGYIRMKIKPEVSAVESTITTSQGNTIPIVSSQQAETNVLVKDGVTIIMGGMIEDATIDDTRKVPFIGDIPILGFPFRKKTVTTRKNELVLFLTPHIITGDVNFYDANIYNVSKKAKEIEKIKTPKWYLNPVEKVKKYLHNEFKEE